MSEGSQFPQIDRRSGLSAQEFKREYLIANQPVVISDATEQWKARSSWTFEFFKSRYGATSIPVHHYQGDRYRTADVKSMPLGEFIQEMLAGDWETYPYYVRDDWSLFIEHQELLDDYEVPKYFFDWFKVMPAFLRLIYPRIFIGPKGALTPLHHDIWETHAWLAQLVGRKRWILFPREQRELLYSYKVRLDCPDFEQFPLLRNAKPVECTIGPGDTIFVPSGWAHQVTSLDATISITHNFMGPGCLWSSISHSIKDRVLHRIKRG